MKKRQPRYPRRPTPVGLEHKPPIAAPLRRAATIPSKEQSESLTSLGQFLIDISTDHTHLQQRGRNQSMWITEDLQDSMLSLLEKPVDEAVYNLISLLKEERSKEASTLSGLWTDMDEELVNRVEDLTKQNDQLLSRCQMLERENTETKTKLEASLYFVGQVDSLKEENERLQESIEQAAKAMMDMNDVVVTAEERADKLSNDNRDLKVSIEEYKQQLHDTIEQAAKSMMDMNSVVVSAEERADKLSNENRDLRASQEEYKQQLQEMKEENERIKRVHFEHEKAALRQEMDSSDREDSRLADLTKSNESLAKANESLTKELEGKNEMVQGVQWALGKLKEEQSTIKETIVELRTENDNLREKATQKNKLGLKYLKESQALKEDNATLSAFLSEETEKTEALRVANEGLAARICKLVSHIQHNRRSGDVSSSFSSANSRHRKGDGSAATTRTPCLSFTSDWNEDVHSSGSSSKRRSKGPTELPIEQTLIQESLHELESSMNVLNDLGLSTGVLF